jgi:aquaporin Z
MKKYIAEMLGTMVLVLMGCGSAVIAGGFIGYMGISFAFGLSVLAMVYAIGGVSGCHINPAITFVMWIAKKINSKDASMYMLFQVIGALIGSGILFLITKDCGAMGANATDEIVPGIIAEVVFTFIFVLVVFGATSSKAPAGFAGIAIGLTLVLVHLVCIPLTGTSVNPARSIAPAIFQGGQALSQLWIFILAPMVGGGLAALCWKGVFEDKKA